MSESANVRLPVSADAHERERSYADVALRIGGLLDGETDWIAALSSVVAELKAAFAYFDWVGFYRLAEPGCLVVGPYQGGHGCLRIPLGRGVCGAAARTRHTQLVPDVTACVDHIACSSSTRSEIVVPLVTPNGRLLGVLDVDSDTADAFDRADQEGLEAIAADLARRFQDQHPL